MQFVVTGALELVRKLDRSKNRILILLEKRRLKKAEINLGFLGWQQAEFFSPELEAQVQRIMHFEKSQADLANYSAECAEKIAALQSERERIRSALADFISENEAEAGPVATQRDDLQKRIAERQRAAANFEKAFAELDLEDRVREANLKKLLSASQESIAIKTESLRLSDRRTLISDEKRNVKLGRERSLQEMDAAEQSLAVIKAQLEKLREKADAKRDDYSREDRGLRSQIDALEREKAKTEKEAEELDQRKADPYLLIGQALAVSDVAPANQPEALAHAHRHRTMIECFERRLAASESESAQVDPWKVRAFYVFLLVLVVLVGLAARFHTKGRGSIQPLQPAIGLSRSGLHCPTLYFMSSGKGNEGAQVNEGAAPRKCFAYITCILP